MEIKPASILLFKVPKADAESDDYESLLSNKGFDAKIIKSLNFEYGNLSILKEKLDNPAMFNGIIFSSPRCVTAVQNALGSSDINAQWKGKYNYVVGNGTYDLALKVLCLDCKGKESGNANNLSEIIIQNKAKYDLQLQFLYPHCNLKMDLLTSKLSPEEIFLDEVCVYNSVPNEKLPDEFQKLTNDFSTFPSFMVFFSPSAIKAAQDVLHKIPANIIENIKLIPIGPTTKTAMLNSGFKVFRVPKQPTPSDLLSVIL